MCRMLELSLFTTMLYIHIAVALLLSLLIPASSATTDTISADQQALTIHDKLVSQNGRYALGFFEAGSNSSQNTSNWYLGIWFNSVSKFTPAWVANRDDPMNNSASLELKISCDGNLVIINRFTNSLIWSTKTNTTTNGTIVMLLNNGNLVLSHTSNLSDILWQSFDYPTDTLFPGAKFGWDKVTGLNRRLVSRKNLISPASGAYCDELDPSGVNQIILAPLSMNSSAPYWSSGVWNGQYFGSMPEMLSQGYNRSFVDNAREKYYTFELSHETLVMHHVMDISGQVKTFIWVEALQDWDQIDARPKAQCDVYATCGPFAVCNDDTVPHCTCVKGFTIRSPEDWELDNRRGGCVRNTAIDCIKNGSTSSSTDKFYSMPCVSLSQSAQEIEATTMAECSQVCLDYCSCTAYSFSNNRCSIWHEELVNIRQLLCSSNINSNGETLYLRLAAKEVQSSGRNRRGFVIGVATSISIVASGLFVFFILITIWRSNRKSFGRILNSARCSNGIIAFRYNDLQHATKNFSDKLGEGGFGSVFKGFINDSIAIAVKSLDCAHQGEKQFRAEVSSIGIIQHINLVKLVGFCCEGVKRLLVYEHMPNLSLDIHLFQSHTAVLKWSTRYQIALGVARGLAYLHENCRDCIIHCDIKPENILLDDSFVPKIADFGMAKFLGRDFSRVLITIRGTIGYLAPEWISGVAITPKVDVYAYGMVLLEILSGRRNACVSCSCGSNHDVYYPVHVANKILEEDVMTLVDHRLNDVNSTEVEIVCKLACWCIQDDESDRPTMGEVVKILEGLLVINIPPMPRLLQSITGSSHSTCC
ncbi:G-type lectin S-receptor-like serine/threonine-protein kinase [Dichanthelium oligosanthes]|uniref:Receptor-like serine/threonine-protein kinase n=1 Tax=Dichanthelium oligosanthes TaxID=888268 RepID=A0A1E5WKA8_9POAL|nr:G-type lectin S-receptor-like serine/threonine-protein kinase [Dichanthelium oligosanthes]